MSLVHSHRELSDSYEKMKKKKIDKFLTNMWMKVKGLWKVLKSKQRLLSSSVECDEMVPAVWLDSYNAKDDAETEGNDSP